MKKFLAILICAIMCIALFVSCDANYLPHKHIKGVWEYNETQHWQNVTCTWNKCDINVVSEDHIDEEKNGACDVCGYVFPFDLNSVAKIVLDYEQELKEELVKLQSDHPEYNYYYNPVDKVYCYFVLDSEASADDIVAKYDMNNLFSVADVSALNAIKMIGVIFERNDFTEDMYRKIKQISEDEALVENLYVEMERVWNQSYMPKIEYYTDYETVLKYEPAPYAVSTENSKDIIIRTKAEYDVYIEYLLEIAEYDYEKERIAASRDLYDESFFEENALIFTRMVVRGSGSIKLTVNNLYISKNKVYVVIRTDIPSMGTDDMQYASFAFVVDKNDVVNVNEVITLE